MSGCSLTRGGQLLVSTYSPAYDKWNYYPEYVDSLVYDLDLIETPLSIRTTDFAVGLDIFPLEASDNRTYDTLFAGFTYGGRDFYTPLLLKDSEELLYAVPEDGNNYTEQSLRYGEAWPAGVLPSLRFGGENTPPASDSYSSAFSLLPTADGLPVLSSGGPDFDASFSDSGGYVQTLTGGALWVTTLHTCSAGIRRINRPVLRRHGGEKRLLESDALYAEGQNAQLFAGAVHRLRLRGV
ncbi:MAG: hypothetical protein ACLUFV_13045 [Acutalibacteraceae bacterium]